MLAVASLASQAAAREWPPLVMGPVYAEPARTADNPAPPSAGGCPVEIAELKDTRRAPKTLGELDGFKAVEAPADRDAWLQSVFTVGLAARGFKPSFTAAGAEPAAGVVTAHVRLQSLWLMTQATNKTGSVVLRVAAAGPGGPAFADKAYRGDQTTVNWAGTTSEFNGLTDRIFADALDGMAADLRPLCPAEPATTASR